MSLEVADFFCRLEDDESKSAEGDTKKKATTRATMVHKLDIEVLNRGDRRDGGEEKDDTEEVKDESGGKKDESGGDEGKGRKDREKAKKEISKSLDVIRGSASMKEKEKAVRNLAKLTHVDMGDADGEKKKRRLAAGECVWTPHCGGSGGSRRGHPPSPAR